MSVSRDKETELIGLLSRFIRESDDDIPFRPAEQEAELERRTCSAPELGRWIGSTDFPFLIETLMLSDAVFGEEFPDLALPAEERKRFANALERHCEDCPRCGLKRAYDLAWQARVNTAISENKEAVEEAIARALAER